MKPVFIEYPKCSTCVRAKKCLTSLGVDFIDRHIVEETPTKEELTDIYKRSGLPLKKFFNTSGKLYKELSLKDQLPTMSEDEQLTLLSSNGMLIKRPILVTSDVILVGFKEDNYVNLFK